MLKDDEIAAVLTYVRNSFGNKADPIRPEKVAEIREKIPINLVFIHRMNF